MGHEDNFLETARRCQGDLIAFCDQDDVWRANKLEKCRAYFNTPNVLLVMHTASVVDADLKPLGHMFPALTHTQIAPARHVYPWRPAPGFAMLFSSQLVRDFDWHNRPEDIMSRDKRPLGHDHWVLAIANLLGEVVLLAEDLTLHRRHTNNTTGKMETGTNVCCGKASIQAAALTSDRAKSPWPTQNIYKVWRARRWEKRLLPFKQGWLIIEIGLINSPCAQIFILVNPDYRAR